MFRLFIVVLLTALGYGTFAPAAETHIPLVVNGEGEQATPTVTGTITEVATATVTATNTRTQGGNATPTSTATPTPTTTDTATPTATNWIIPGDTNTPTQTPTITPTPTTTSSPTTTPTLTPTATDPVGDGITVLSNHSAYVDSADFLNIVGEARNDSGGNAELVKVAVTLFNSQGVPVDSETTYVFLEVLPAADKGCFEAFFIGNPSYSYYEFETEYTATADVPRPLTIVNHNAIYNNTIGWLNVVGQIRNDGGGNLTFPQVFGTLYDTAGRVIDCRFTYATADDLDPGEMSIWEVTFRQVPEEEIGGYRIQPD